MAEFSRAIRSRGNLTREDALALIELVNNEYWMRQWVVQEMILSRLPIVVYGQRVLPWRDMKTLMFTSPELETWLRTKTSTEGSEESVSSRYLEMLGLVFDEKDNQPADSFESEMEGLRWFRCMQLAGWTHCADPRDKVYGIQNLLEPHLRIDVDYSLSAEDIFFRAASVYLKSRLFSTGTLLNGLAPLANGMGFVVPDEFYVFMQTYMLGQDEDLPGSFGIMDEAEAHVVCILKRYIDTSSGRSRNTKDDTVA